MHRDYGDRGLAVVAIDFKESRERVAAWVKERNVTFTVALDPDGKVTSAYGVTVTPTVYVIGRDGTMIARAFGTKEWMGSRGRAFLEALLRR